MNVYADDILEPLSADAPIATVSRVVGLAPALGLAALMPLDGGKSRTRLPHRVKLTVLEAALDCGSIKKTKFELPRLMLRDEKDLTGEQKAKRNLIFEDIKDLVAPDNLKVILFSGPYSQDRGALIKSHAKAKGILVPDVYRKLGRYFFYGSARNAFLRNDPAHRYQTDKIPKTARGRRKHRLINGRMEVLEPKVLTDDDIANFKWATETYVEKGKPVSVAFKEMLGNRYNVGYTEKDGHLEPILIEESARPSLKQYGYWLTTRHDSLELKKKQIGEREWGKTLRPILGSAAAETYGAGHRSQTDTTFFKNGSLVSSYDRSVLIGSPIAMLVMDVRTEMITGLHASVGSPKYNFARVALLNTVCDKVEFCKRFGISITRDEWPCNVLANTTAFDAGELFTEDGKRGQVSGLHCIIERSEGGRPDLRGLIEGTFAVVKGKVILLDAGLAKKAHAGRGAPSPIKGACLTLDEFIAILIYIVLWWNKTHDVTHLMTPEMIAAGIEHVPLALWKFSLEHENGHPYRPSPALVNAHLLPRTSASVRGDGIYVNGLRYATSKALAGNWYSRGRIGEFQVGAGFDPDDPGSVEIFDENGDYFDHGSLIDPFARYAHRRLTDILQWAEHEKTLKDRANAVADQVTAATSAHITSIVKTARVLTNHATQGRGHSRGKPSIEARKAEQVRQTMRDRNIWYSPSPSPNTHAAVPAPRRDATKAAESRDAALLYGEDGNEK